MSSLNRQTLLATAALTALSATASLHGQDQLIVDENTTVRTPATRSATQPTVTYIITEGEYKHLDRQTEVALTRIAPALDANPPMMGDVSTDRAMALTLLDTVLHDPSAPQRSSIGKFRAARTKQAVEDMLKTKITDDSAVVWQVYNMGFVVRTKSVTLGFDLVKLTHVPAFSLENDLMKAVIDQCDVLFVSHEHLDHSDREVTEWFLAGGKPVLAPPSMWAGEPLHPRMTQLERNGKDEAHELSVRSGQAKLKVTVLPGFQRGKDGSGVENNVYIVTTPEGIRVAHTGDNNVPEGLPGAGSIKDPVDLLLMKLEPGQLKSREIIKAFNPRLSLPSHFCELGHVNVNGREPFWRGMERSAKLNTPTLIMMWGERFQYTRPAK